MTDPRIAALAEAHICSGWCNHPELPTVIVTLAYLHSQQAEIARLRKERDRLIENADILRSDIARLRRIEEAAGEYLATLDGPLSARYSRSVALATLRAALEEKP